MNIPPQSHRLLRGVPVENRAAPVLAAESFLIHSPLADFLTGIDHERRPVEIKGSIECGECIYGILSEEIRCEALLVVIFQEIQHIWLQISERLPVPGNLLCRLPGFHGHSAVVSVLLHNRPYGVVHAGLVIEKVEANLTYIFGIQFFLIYLGNEGDVWMEFVYLPDKPGEEIRWNQLDHVASEPVDTHSRPEIHDVKHLVPCTCMSVAIIDLDGIIPVVHVRFRSVSIT